MKIGDTVEVIKPFYWHDQTNRHEVGERFIVTEKHVGRKNLEKNYLKVVTPTTK